MRISDWSSDVCSSDLIAAIFGKARRSAGAGQFPIQPFADRDLSERQSAQRTQRRAAEPEQGTLRLHAAVFPPLPVRMARRRLRHHGAHVKWRLSLFLLNPA